MNEQLTYAEDAVLGCILAENYLIKDLQLKEDYFSGQRRMLYKAMKVLDDTNLSIDMVTLLTKTNPQDFGGANLIQHVQKFGNVKKVDSYLKVLEDTYKQREKEKVLRLALEENWPIGGITSALSDIDTDTYQDGRNIKEIVQDMFELPWTVLENTKGMNTGINKLNEITSGFQDSELIVLGARPSMGKSDMMMHWAKSAAAAGYKPVIFSLEMADHKLVNRLIGMVGGINRNKLKDPEKLLSDKQKENWSYIMGEISNMDMEFFDAYGQTVSEIRSKVRKVQGENPGKKLAIFLDYLTLVRSEEKYGTEALKVTKIIEQLKGIAKEFSAPFTVLSQLSRSVEQRENKRPMMSDLRESGGIEQCADIIAFLYREGYYTKDQNDRRLELIIAKNREGETGTILCDYSPFTGVIKDAPIGV